MGRFGLGRWVDLALVRFGPESFRPKSMAEAIRTTVVPIRILIRTTVVPIRILIGTTVSYRHDKNIRFSSKLNYALFCILMVSFLKTMFYSCRAETSEKM